VASIHDFLGGIRRNAAVGLTLPTRLIHGTRHHGVRNALRIVAHQAQSWLLLDEEHIWYVLDLPSQHAAPFADVGGLRLMSPRLPHEFAAFGALPSVSPAGAERRVRDGGEAYLVLEGDVAAFACWIFPERTPTPAARGNWLALPEGVACLETRSLRRTHAVAA
jgi:hypothetical protein